MFKRSKQPLLLAILLLVVALPQIGCGSDGDSSSSEETASTPAPPLSKAVFVKKANALCEEDRVAAIRKATTLAAQKTEGSKRGVELELFTTLILPGAYERLDRVRNLGIPSGDEDQVEAILDVIEEEFDKAKSDPESFFEAQVHFKYPLKKAQVLASRYGILECVQP